MAGWCGSRAASQEELDVWTAKQAVAAAERLKAIAAVEQATLQLGFTKVTAPIAGKTSRTQVTVGNLVNAGGGETLLTTITSVDPMYVYFDVDERSLLRYRREFRKDKAESRGRTPDQGTEDPGRCRPGSEEGSPHKGVIDFADNQVNASTGTMQVRGVLPNTDRILDAGMRAHVRVPVSDPHKVLMVTERAIGTDQGRKFVYVVNDQDVVERRDVKLGRLSRWHADHQGRAQAGRLGDRQRHRARAGWDQGRAETSFPARQQITRPAHFSQPSRLRLSKGLLSRKRLAEQTPREQPSHVCTLLCGSPGLRDGPLGGDHHRGPGRPL